MSHPRSWEEFDDLGRDQGKSVTKRVVRVYGERASETGLLYGKGEKQYETGDGLEDLEFYASGECDFGHLLGTERTEIAGRCTICGEWACTQDGCCYTCTKCGNLICRKHTSHTANGPVCNRHLPEVVGVIIAKGMWRAHVDRKVVDIMSRMSADWNGRWNNRLTLERLVEVLAPVWPEAEEWAQLVQMFPQHRDRVFGLLIRRCRQFDIDPADPFQPLPTAEQLPDGELHLGEVPEVGTLLYPIDALCTSILACGSPKSGKTVFLKRAVFEATRRGVGTYIPDRRGDYRDVVQSLDDSLLVPADQDLFNPLEPPRGVPRQKWMHIAGARLTLDLGMQGPGQLFAVTVLAEVDRRADDDGRIATLPDVESHLENMRAKPRSPEEGFRDRLLMRVKALLELYGRDALSPQRGFPILDKVENGRVVVHDLSGESSIASFITSLMIVRIYCSRLHRPNRFNQPPLLILLDEQRDVIRARSIETGVAEIEGIFTKSRAFGIGFLVAEQVPSQVSPALLQSCWFKAGFCSSPPESFEVARLLGLNQGQAAELQKLPVGQAIVRMAGDRVPHPFKLVVPYPDALMQ